MSMIDWEFVVAFVIWAKNLTGPGKLKQILTKVRTPLNVSKR